MVPGKAKLLADPRNAGEKGGKPRLDIVDLASIHFPARRQFFRGQKLVFTAKCCGQDFGIGLQRTAQGAEVNARAFPAKGGFAKGTADSALVAIKRAGKVRPVCESRDMHVSVSLSAGDMRQ